MDCIKTAIVNSHHFLSRDLCRKYKDLYKQKLLQVKPSDSLVKTLEVFIKFS